LSNEIIYTNLAAKPKLATPAITPEAPAVAPAPQVKRITWGIQGRLHMPATAERSQPRKGDRSAPSDRPSSRPVRAERSPQSRSVAPEAPKVRMRYVDRGSRLERLPEQRSLFEKLERQAARPALEHLTILHSPKAQQYWIADAETGEVFQTQAFRMLKHCHEAAALLERTFDMEEVLKLRPSETLEQIELLVQAHCQREKTEIACRQLLQLM
jgi:hypothetical protein